MAKKAKKSTRAKKDLCAKCAGLCCRYFALPLEDPEDWDDYDDMRWYLMHEDITVFVEDDDWYINIRNKCKYYCEKTNKCVIYTKRPRICRRYSTKDCDLTTGEYAYELHFKNDHQMEEYMKIKFGDKVFEKLEPKKRKKKKRKKKK